MSKNQEQAAAQYPPVAARQARDRAQYVRQQKGHSVILAIFITGPLTLFIAPIYWSVSPNHYWHA